MNETSPAAEPSAPARRLRAVMAACRLRVRWPGTRRALTPEQRARAAEAFDARESCLTAGKKLLDTAHPAFRAVTAIRGEAEACWRSMSLPFPEPGVRLVPQGRIP